jgi:hypothetical protein
MAGFEAGEPNTFVDSVWDLRRLGIVPNAFSEPFFLRACGLRLAVSLGEKSWI